MNSLLGTDEHIVMSPASTTAKFHRGIVNKNNTQIKVIDTRGLAEDEKEKTKELKKVASYTKGKADILLYCVPVGPGSKFGDHNPVTMRCLTKAFGKQIWDHCVLVFTMGNVVLLSRKDTATEEYKKYLDEYAKKI